MTRTPLWTPTHAQIEQARVTDFRNAVNRHHGTALETYDELYDWSVEYPENFWSNVWDYAGIVGDKGQTVLDDAHRFPGAKWFPQAQLNFAENLLAHRSDDETAIYFQGENIVSRELTFGELTAQVSRLSQAMRAMGIVRGDRVAGFMPNVPETVIAMLATASIGAIWSSCSPDFGVKGVVDRFGQIEPKLLFTANGYYYNGKAHESISRVREFAQPIPSIEKIVVVDYIDNQKIPQDWSTYDAFVEGYAATEIEFTRLPFSHPLYVMYSSGTTGVPKSIVHSAGGTLIQHVKEHLLHGDTLTGDRVFYFTTCGWMMWNWLVSALACKAAIALYDGSPFYPDGNVLFDYAQRIGMTCFGTSAKYIDSLNKAGVHPISTHDLSSVRSILSTGSPLSPEGFEYVYTSVKADLRLSSISGGTDIISCFALGCPIKPVYTGELQTRGLGMAVDVFDDNAQPIKNEKGELVCTHPFPSAPIGFWNDADGSRYHSAYFDQYENIWCHGDYVELTERGGMIFYGRSDAVLNPGGVRIGTAEIYRQVEALDEIEESIVIGQNWNNDTRVVLFVKLRDGISLNEQLVNKIKQHIRAETTPRHVPAKVLQVNDIPRTKSGKIVELAVRNVIHNEPIKNKEALANPDALELFKNRDELQS
ncbi:MAG: acetoacetate--CoA ligase [Pseudomonadota bacterium]